MLPHQQAGDNMWLTRAQRGDLTTGLADDLECSRWMIRIMQSFCWCDWTYAWQRRVALSMRCHEYAVHGCTAVHGRCGPLLPPSSVRSGPRLGLVRSVHTVMLLMLSQPAHSTITEHV